MIISIDAIDLVLAVSAGGLGGCEVPANSNAGPFVERRLKRVGLPKGQPWCAADVAETGAIALGPRWPLPLTGGCVVLAEFAEKKQVLYDTPKRGDVFLIWHAELGRFAHTGFNVDQLDTTKWHTHEGNTSGGGSREGWLKAERERVFTPKDRFIRWTELLR